LWIDDGYDGADGDSASFFGDTEVRSLSDVGITAIDLGSTAVGTTDAQSNTLVRIGTFRRADGTTRKIAEYAFQRDTYDTVYQVLAVPADIEALPNIRGRGNVYSLHQAIVRDGSGHLKGLVQAFMAETNSSARANVFQKLIFKWHGADAVVPSSRGPFIDARKMASLEAIYGRELGNVESERAEPFNIIFLQQAEYYYAALMSESHLADLYRIIKRRWDPQTKSVVLRNTSAAAALLQAEIGANPAAGRERLSEFARMLRGFGYGHTSGYVAFRETLVAQDPALGVVIDSGNFPSKPNTEDQKRNDQP